MSRDSIPPMEGQSWDDFLKDLKVMTYSKTLPKALGATDKDKLDALMKGMFLSVSLEELWEFWNAASSLKKS